MYRYTLLTLIAIIGAVIAYDWFAVRSKATAPATKPAQATQAQPEDDSSQLKM